MAHNAGSERKTSETAERIRDEVPVRRMGVREFRVNLKAVTKAGEPLILTRGRDVVGAFVPVDMCWWTVQRDCRATAVRFRKDAERIARTLETP